MDQVLCTYWKVASTVEEFITGNEQEQQSLHAVALKGWDRRAGSEVPGQSPASNLRLMGSARTPAAPTASHKYCSEKQQVCAQRQDLQGEILKADHLGKKNTQFIGTLELSFLLL